MERRVELGLQNVGEDEGTGHKEAAIQVEGGEDGLDGIGEQSGFAAASGFLLAAAEAEIAAQLQQMGAVEEVIGIDEVGAQFGELAFLVGREALEKLLAGDQLQHGIAEKLELLVVGGGLDTLTCEGGMGQRLLQQRAIGELVAHGCFESVQRKMVHKRAGEKDGDSRFETGARISRLLAGRFDRRERVQARPFLFGDGADLAQISDSKPEISNPKSEISDLKSAMPCQAATVVLPDMATEPNPGSVVVNSISDEVHSEGGSLVSLRDAIAVANSSATPKTITFDPTVFAAAQTIVLTGGQLELSNTEYSTTIIGPAAGVTFSGNRASRVLQVDKNVTARISRVVITNGKSSHWGGGVCNFGFLTLTNDTIANNSASYVGGGIYNAESRANIALTNVTIANNSSARDGGGLFNDQHAVLTNVTVCGNSASLVAAFWQTSTRKSQRC